MKSQKQKKAAKNEISHKMQRLKSQLDWSMANSEKGGVRRSRVVVKQKPVPATNEDPGSAVTKQKPESKTKQKPEPNSKQKPGPATNEDPGPATKKRIFKQIEIPPSSIVTRNKVNSGNVNVATIEKNSSAATNETKAGPTNISSSKPGPTKKALTGSGPTKVAPIGSRPTKVAPIESGPTKIAQTGAGSIKVTQTGPGTTKVAQTVPGRIKIAPTEPGPSKILQISLGPTKIASGPTTANTGPGTTKITPRRSGRKFSSSCSSEYESPTRQLRKRKIPNKYKDYSININSPVIRKNQPPAKPKDVYDFEPDSDEEPEKKKGRYDSESSGDDDNSMKYVVRELRKKRKAKPEIKHKKKVVQIPNVEDSSISVVDLTVSSPEVVIVEDDPLTITPPKTAPPKITLPKIALPKIAFPKIALPETALPETAPPETAPPETAPPETTPPETTLESSTTESTAINVANKVAKTFFEDIFKDEPNSKIKIVSMVLFEKSGTNPGSTVVQIGPASTNLAPIGPEPTNLAQIEPEPTNLAQIEPEPTNLAQIESELTTVAHIGPGPTKVAPTHSGPTKVATTHSEPTKAPQIGPGPTISAPSSTMNTVEDVAEDFFEDPPEIPVPTSAPTPRNIVEEVTESFLELSDEEINNNPKENQKPWRIDFTAIKRPQNFTYKDKSFTPRYDPEIIFNDPKSNLKEKVIAEEAKKNVKLTYQASIVNYMNGRLPKINHELFTEAPKKVQRKILGELNFVQSTPLKIKPALNVFKSPNVSQIFGFCDDKENSPCSPKKTQKQTKKTVKPPPAKVVETPQKVVETPSKVTDVKNENVTHQQNLTSQQNLTNQNESEQPSEISIELFQDLQEDLEVSKKTARKYVRKNPKRKRLLTDETEASDDEPEPEEVKKKKRKKNARTKAEENEANRLASFYNSMFDDIEKHELIIE